MRRKKTLAIVLIMLVVLVGTPIAVWDIWHRAAQKKLDEARQRYEAKLTELREQGEPLTLRELVPPEIPDEDNAAIVYQEAFKQLDLLLDPGHGEVSRLFSKRPLEPAELEQARELIGQVKPVLDLFYQAALRDTCRFAMDDEADPLDAILFPLLRNAQSSTRLLRLAARVELASGQPDEAVRHCVGMLKLARSNEARPSIISMLVDVAVTNMAREQLMGVLDESEPSAESLSQILKVLGDPDDRGPLLRGLKGERTFLIAGTAEMLKHPEKWSKGGEFEASVSENLEGRRGKLMIYADGANYLSAAEQALRLAQEPWHKSGSAWQKLEQETQNKREIRSTTNWMKDAPIFDRPVGIFDEGLAVTGCGKLAVALRLCRLEHGEYPDNLSALVPEFLDKLPTDPFSGKDYIYRKEEKGFLLYSIGENMTDNGGVEDRKNREAGDIVWECSR